MAHNSVGAEGIRALAPCLPCCGGLRELQLAGNQLGDPGVKALAAVLPSLPMLASLQLQHNYSVGIEGVRALATAIGSGGCVSLQVGGTRVG